MSRNARRADDDPLSGLAAACGIETSWRHVDGTVHQVPRATLTALLAAMDIEAATDRQARASLKRLHEHGAAAGHPSLLVAAPGELPRLSAAAGTTFELELEDGTRKTGRLARGGTLPGPLPPGRHSLVIAGSEEEPCTLVVGPPACPAPADLGAGRAWGVTAQAYALRGTPDHGIGDFTAIAEAATLLGREGADFLGLNPLHALFPADPGSASPYAPSSRRWLNVLYVDPHAAACLCGGEPGGMPPGDPAFIDYQAAGRARLGALERVFDAFQQTHLAQETALAREFRRWRDAHGQALERHALFDALHEAALRRAPEQWAHWTWPEGLRSPDAPEARRFARENERRITFFAFLQWLADGQLGQAQQAARAAGMRLGLYCDLAVGMNPGGSMVWSEPHLALKGVSVGAPPDSFSPRGQNWGLAPLSPTALAAHAYEPLMEDLRASMRHAGAIRIDHIIGFDRQFWIPDGAAAAEGAYVRLPFKTLARLIAFEAQRAGCLVIGEDLGTVPRGLPAAMRRAGMLSCRVLWFERKNGATRQPEDYPELALASISTHDLPTARGYWSGNDIGWRERLGLFVDATQPAREHRRRTGERRRLVTALLRAGVLAEKDRQGALKPEASLALVEALHRFLARSRSALVAVQVEDLAGMEEQVNLPGTVEEHPNWRRRLPRETEALLATDEARRLLALMREERPREA
ncbi:4-alpha-glucanotransferase [Marinimicrococcus flavescens]|uniref:4-alpha-glucanotransferase n=1 Tax=Marinimicrococcus flavescens TaxID=3031815 RepID=A0AAP3XR06_9PROT|nr:4-alpha-glucanotransferase [Marinimicrococcus flavescens]